MKTNAKRVTYQIYFNLTDDAKIRHIKATGFRVEFLTTEINYGDDEYDRAVDLIGLSDSGYSPLWLEGKFNRDDMTAKECLDVIEERKNAPGRILKTLDIDAIAISVAEHEGNLYPACFDLTEGHDSCHANELKEAILSNLELCPRIFALWRSVQQEKKDQLKARDAEHDMRKENAKAEQEKFELHGSDRLKRLVKEEIECERTYRDERLAAEYPDWRWIKKVQGVDEQPRNAPLEAIDLLDSARQAIETAQLVRWEIHHTCNDGCFHGECPEYDWEGYAATANCPFDESEGVIFGGPPR